MRKILDSIENTAAKLQHFGEKAVDRAAEHLVNFKPVAGKAVEEAKDILSKAGNGIEYAAENAREAVSHAIDSLTSAEELPTATEDTACEESPTPFETIEDDVQSQLNQIRTAQNTPGVFSDYISKKFGKKDQ